MTNNTEKNFSLQLLQTAGITVGGQQPWDIKVHNEQFYARALNESSLGLGESYVDGWWDCNQLDMFFDRLLRARLDEKAHIPLHFYFKKILAHLINLQTKRRAKEVAYKHYDLGNPLFKAMLDKNMLYSCGYWRNATTLDDAQIAKLELICQKLQLKPGQRLLDIGCGWGGLAKYAAEHFGVHVVGVTISEEQHDYAKQFCAGQPIDIRLQDYRDINETFDRIVSVGMFEHVGHLNYKTFMTTVHRALADDGLFLLHSIGANYTDSLSNEWIIKYIFPNGMLPSLTQVDQTSEHLFILEDLQNFGGYYDQTLMAWYKNFIDHWDELKSHYDERFYRMWTYYLLACAGNFRARANQLWQFVFSKHGVSGVYIAPR